jgi:hypothetical protein
VVHEAIDGETIAIHLGTGTYYSLDGVAGVLWSELASGCTRAELVTRAQERFDAESATVAAATVAFLDELLEEQLIVERPGQEAPAPQGAGRGSEPFSPPILERYTEMQEFMLVDPLHEVDVTIGWPNVKAE